MKVLVVEDAPFIRERLRSMMESIKGIRLVGEADNEPDALLSIRDHQPDVLILDIALAGGSGLGVLRQIRLLQLPLQVIMLTNYANAQYRKKCLELGAGHFLDKTQDIEALATLLARMAKGGRSEPEAH